MFSIPSHILDQLIDQILLPSLFRFLFVGGACSLIIGIGLIVRSELMFQTFERMNRWVSCRRATRALEIPRDSWPLIQRYRYPLAAFITIGAIYSAMRLLTDADVEAVVPDISHAFQIPAILVSWILVSAKYFLLLGSAVAIVVGLMLAFALTTLLKAEMHSNTWISTRNNELAKKANAPNHGLDNLVMTFPRTAGWVVTIASMVEVTLVGLQMH